MTRSLPGGGDTALFLAMSRPTEFITDLRAYDVSEGMETNVYELSRPFTVYSSTLQAEITVPAGFRCDGESIPVSLRWLVPPFGQSKRGAFVHDYLYRLGGYRTPDGRLVAVTRAQADAVYRELILAKGLPRWRATMRHAVLRLVGWSAWRRHAPHRHEPTA